MNILHISPYVPSVNTYHAGGVCMGKEVETLRKKNNVFVLSFINDEKEANLVKEEYSPRNSKFIKMNTFYKIFNAILNFYKPSFFSIRASFRFSYNLIKIIKKQKIDVIHAEYTSMGQYVWIKKFFPNIEFNLVEHDVTIQSYQRHEQEQHNKFIKIYRKIQTNLVYRSEKKYCKAADVIFTLNKKDEKLLKDIYNLKNVLVLNPYYGIDFEIQNSNVKKIKNSICFVGQMSRTENDLAAKRLINIFNTLDNNNDYKLFIIGAHPTKQVLSKANDNIIITGFVDVIEDYIKKCEIAVFPLEYGAGIKLKVLLSCGLGLPVITTDIGAEGIDEEGNVLILAQTDNEIKEKIEMLFNDRKVMKQIADSSKDFIKKNFNWSKTVQIFDSVYNKNNLTRG